MTRSTRGADDDAGQVAIELVGAVFLLMVVTLLAVQGIVAAQAVTVAQDAARDGARALSQGRDWRDAANDKLGGSLVVEELTAEAGGRIARVSVTVRVPIGLPNITSGDLTVSRYAEFPMEASPWP